MTTTRPTREPRPCSKPLPDGSGFRDVAFVYEPIAAAHHYEQTVQGEELVLIADIGGGTSDFSVIRVGPQRRERPDRSRDVLATAGVRVGGTDFDAALSLAAVMPLLGLGTQLVEKNLPMPSALVSRAGDLGDDQLRLHLQERARARRAGPAGVRARESGTPAEDGAAPARPSPGVCRGGRARSR